MRQAGRGKFGFSPFEIVVEINKEVPMRCPPGEIDAVADIIGIEEIMVRPEFLAGA